MKKLLTAIMTITLLTSTNAADISIEKKYQINIDGEIKRGDAEKVASLLSKMQALLRVQVNSPGGDVLESIRIASLRKV